MPARVIRGEINASRSLSRVSLEADLTFRALIVAVDDFGRMEADPLMLKAALFPRRESVKPAKIREWLDELVSEGCVELYRVRGVEYLALSGWEDHRGKTNRAKTSRFPSPQDADRPSTEPPGDPGRFRENPSERGVERSGEGGVSRDGSGGPPGGPAAGAADRPSKSRLPPESLEADDWRRLVERIWNSKPHLVAKDESPPMPHCSLGWVRSQTNACLDHFRGKGTRRPDWPATCSSWVHKSDEELWSRAKRAPPPKGEYHADPETFMPDVLKENHGPARALAINGGGASPAPSPSPAEHIARAGAKPALRLADPRA